MSNLSKLDKSYFWHPFTQMEDWINSKNDPIIIESAKGSFLKDIQGNRYLDGNSSIWTNIHGHCHPTINKYISKQLNLISHSSALGFSNKPAILLAEKLVNLFSPSNLSRVFFSDNGSTAIECACKMSIQYRQINNQKDKINFLSFDGAYHGDTLGAGSLGAIDVFNSRFSKFGYPVKSIKNIHELESISKYDRSKINALIIEPLVQGAAGIRLWEKGLLKQIREWCDKNEIFLIADEVMTGFGRTGEMFACNREGVIPDFVCLAKGLSGGYMPMAATITKEFIFDVFRGKYEEMRTFFYGHSYCANPLGAASSLGNLKVFEEENTIINLKDKISSLKKELDKIKDYPFIGNIRQIGLISGIDFIDKNTGEKFNWKYQMGSKACLKARYYGVLTRPIGDTIIFMPPLCTSSDHIKFGIESIFNALKDTYL